MRGRGSAAARWGWSGVAPLTAAQLASPDIDLSVLLPNHKSPIEQIVLRLRDLGGRYHRYLHQDEFGPTRAERMTALRLLLDQLVLLSSQLHGLPHHLRGQLSTRLASRASPIERDTDNFTAYSNDQESAELVGEAATNYRCMPGAASAAGDARLMDDLGDTAQKTAELLGTLDTTTAGAVAIDTPLARLEFAESAERDLIDFAVVCARIERLRGRLELALAGLERRKGPERSESLRWLVWQLCDLYHEETGLPVTNSAVANNHYQSSPQSPAGTFVLTAAAALPPSDLWSQDHRQWVRGNRARALEQGGLKRAVLYAMREYVAHHASRTDRRGRWQRVAKRVS